MPNENVIRTILKNEVTWTIAIVLGIWGFVQTVILPLNSLQIGVAEINSKLVNSQVASDALNEKVQENSDEIIRLGGRVDVLEKRIP